MRSGHLLHVHQGARPHGFPQDMIPFLATLQGADSALSPSCERRLKTRPGSACGAAGGGRGSSCSCSDGPFVASSSGSSGVSTGQVRAPMGASGGPPGAVTLHGDPDNVEGTQNSHVASHVGGGQGGRRVRAGWPQRWRPAATLGTSLQAKRPSCYLAHVLLKA